MRSIAFTSCFLVCTIGAVSSEDKPEKEEFTSLFNGKDLEGWEGNEELWKVEDGVLVGDSPGINQNEFLATKAKYENFELHMEFRLKKGEGNSGVQFRSEREKGSSAIIGYQADIGEGYWGCLYDEHRRNKVLVPASDKLEKVLKKDGWNSYVIRAEGENIKLIINDVTTVEYKEEDEKIAREGIIAIQIHSGGPMRIEFKDIKIKELE